MNTFKIAAIAAAISFFTGAAQAATFSATDLDIVVDRSTDFTSFEVGDLGAISSLEITLGVSSCGSNFALDGACTSNSNPFNNELSLQLQTGAGTLLDLVTVGTYLTGAAGTSASLTFEDGAALPGGNTLVSGVFGPANPLSSLFGELAEGTWSVIIGDSVGLDPKRLDSYSVTINGVDAPAPVPLPAGLPLLLAGLAGLGIASRKRRAS